MLFAHRIVLTVFVFSSFWPSRIAIASPETGTNRVETFRRFVNGDVPVKEAVVFREYLKADGKLLNREWYRFAFERRESRGETWFLERLAPSFARKQLGGE